MPFFDCAMICKALGDETRIKIFDMLKGGELCACKILEKFKFSQPTLSYHMKILLRSGLIQCTKQGKWCHYRINKDALDRFAEFINKPICERKDLL